MALGDCTIFDAIERFPKCHLSKHIESNHSKPFGQVETFGVGAELPDFIDESIDTFFDNILLLKQGLVSKPASQ